MKIQHKTLLVVSALVMLCNINGFEKANAIDITPGQTYENNVNGASNSILGQGNTIYAGVNVNRGQTLEIKDNTFNNNSSSGEAIMGFIPGGGGVVYDWGGKIVIDKSLFNENTSTSTGFKTGGGAAMLYQTKEFEIKNESEFNRNSAAQSGGAIYFAEAQNGTVDNTKFVGNTAGISGGALHFDNRTKNITITNSQFNNNRAGDKETPNTYGGAVAINGLSISETNENQYAISNSTFEGNESYSGGALHVSSSEVSFNELTFNNNEARTGGAVEILSSGTYGTGVKFYNSHFTNNTADENGGAVYGWGDFKFENSDFSNNKAMQGGAMYVANDGANIIRNTTFEGNQAEYLGGAIAVSEGTLQIDNSRFEGNHAGTRGGALTFSVTNNNTSETPMKFLLINNTDFINNTCGQESGGAIYINVDETKEGLKEVRIVSDDGETHEFTGNTHTDYADRVKPNAIYINQGTVNLRTANEGSKLLFNDGIEGANLDKAHVNVDGDVTVNAQIKNVDLTLDNGNLILNSDNENSTLTADMPVLENVDLTLNSGTLDMQNEKLDTLNLRDFNINGDGAVKVAMDADLSKGISDTFNITGNMSEGLKFDAEHFDIKLKDGKADKFKLFNNTGSELSYVGEAVVQYTNDTKYTMTLQDDGFVSVIRKSTTGLAGAIDANGIREFRQNPASDLTISSDLGQMNGEYLKINMDSRNLNGDGNKGLIVSENQRLELANINSANGFKTENNGAVVDNAGKLTINNSVFKNNSAEVNGGVIANSGETTITDSSFINNTAKQDGGAIYNEGGKITITAATKDVVFEGNKANAKPNDIFMANTDSDNAELAIKGSKNTSLKGGIAGEGIVTKDGSGTLNLGGNNNNYTGDVVYNGGTTNLLAGATYFSAQNTTFNNNAMLNAANNNPNDKIEFGNLHMEGNGRLGLDLDMNTGKSDIISAISTSGEGKLIIDNINMISNNNANATKFAFNIIEKNEDGTSPLNNVISMGSNNNKLYGPIYKYEPTFDPNSGQLLLTGSAGKTHKNYNPAVLTAPTGALVGAYLTQLNTYDMAFNNMDMHMLMSAKDRQVLKLRNRYALLDRATRPYPMNQIEDKGAWVRPYSTFESVRLNNGPRVSNVSYGTFFGADSDLIELKNGFDGVFSLYGSYNGSHQAFKGNGIYQSGGTLGATGVLYKGNFFTGLTANVGASVGDANTMYGSENFTMLMSGIASKTGYNWELADGKFIIQPSYLMSYSFINTFDYTNAANVRISSDPINALQISPGIRFIGNLKNGWQPYLGLSIIWNIMDDTRFKANNVSLPELSVDPYFLYGFGIQKIVGERMTGFFQTMFRSGGRNGVGFQLGFRITL